MADATIRTGREGPVFVIELNRPLALNALNRRMFAELEAALHVADASDARAMLLCSASPTAFSVGTDLKEIAPLSPERIDERNVNARRILRSLSAHRLMSFAHICGHALGGGLELALSCTFRLLSPAAALGLPEIKLGVMPTYGGIHLLSRLVREDVALDMLASGRSLDVDESMRVGLGTRRLATSERSEAVGVVLEFVRHSFAAQKLLRQALADEEHRACPAEQDAIRAAVRLADFREGVTAFLEKRPPAFSDC